MSDRKFKLLLSVEDGFMLNCCEGHTTIVRVAVVDQAGNVISDSQTLPIQMMENIIQSIVEGECPVCACKMPLIKNAG